MSHTQRRLEILREKAQSGDARAQYDLGLTFYRGDGVPQDMNAARLWLTKAADQGQREAHVLLNLEGLRLDQGVQFKLGGAPKKDPPHPKVEIVTRKSISVTVPLSPGGGGNQAAQLTLMEDIRDAIEETRTALPDDEALKERILEGLAAMLKCLRTGSIPDPHTRGMMSLGSIVFRGLEEYGGLDAYKRKVYRIGRAFEDLKDLPATQSTTPPEATVRQGGAESESLTPPLTGSGRFRGGDKHANVARAVDAIEAELRRLGWWSETPPTAEQMAFTAAFAMDTMPLSKWVQFILLPRVRAIIEQRGAFPASSMVGAHAVREYDGQDAGRLVELLSEFDDVVME
jgi:uncharacterized protein YqcC (DUF446 family)